MLLDTLGDSAVREAGVFRPRAVRRMIDDHLAERQDHGRPLFALFMFEQWRRRWLVESQAPALRLAA